MRLSKKGEYGTRALIEIGLNASQEPDQLMQIAAVAERTRIPEKFLEQILLTLKNGGVLKSKRGIEGGYALNRPAEQITLGEVIRLLDGPLAPIPCVSKTAYEPCTCPNEETCGLHLAMQEVRDALSKILDHYTLARVVDDVRQRKAALNGAISFDI
jgi:Rrf2 family protein